MKPSDGPPLEQERLWGLVSSEEEEPLIESKLSWLFNGKLDQYTRSFVFATVAFAIYALAYACASSMATLGSGAYQVFVDAVSVFVALLAYSSQCRAMMTSLKNTRPLFTIASHKVSTPENGKERRRRIVILKILSTIFWSLIVQNCPRFAYPSDKSDSDKRWKVTGLFTTSAVAIWIIILLAAHAHTMGPAKEGLWWWLGYSLYFALITILAIPVAMLPPRKYQGITEQCWFVFKSHIVYDIPLFYAAVAFSYSLFFYQATTGVNILTVLQASEFAFVVFFGAVAVVTLLDTSITIWTLVNSGQLNYLELMAADSHGGLGPFYRLIDSNTIILGAIAMLYSLRVIIPVITNTHTTTTFWSIVYTIPGVIGVPLLMAMTWVASVYFLRRRTVQIKEHFMEDLRSKGDHENTQIQWPVPVRCLPKKWSSVSDMDELTMRDRITRIQSWPRTSSIVATVLSSGYIAILTPLLHFLGLPTG
jgi:hypothetical protein